MLVMFIGVYFLQVYLYTNMSKYIKLSSYSYIIKDVNFLYFERYVSEEGGTKLKYFPVTEPYKHV